MALISLQDISIGFGGPRLLEEINLQIESGESIGLLGRNGMGKSTCRTLEVVNASLDGEHPYMQFPGSEFRNQKRFCFREVFWH